MARPVALSLSGFSFSYRSSYFDWRLLHGIDVDTVIRLTDVKAVEDCLDTLQHGSFGAERDRLSPANCVQLFRLLQLAVEYCAHLRAAHALLLDCYGAATAAAEGWKVSARAYLDAGGAFLAESMAAGMLSRPYLDATDAAKAGLENADRSYNAVLDALEAEDSRARHFRFRKHRTELSWATLHAADADRLVASLDLAALEGLMPNLTYGSITNEDDEQLTPHHFGQIIPLAQAALDYVLWQANATGALLEQSMAALQAACGDIPLLTTATQDMHANITSLLLEAQQMGGAVSPGAGGMALGYSSAAGGGLPEIPIYGTGFGSQSASAGLGGPAGPWASASVDVGQSHGQFGSGNARPGTPPALVRVSSPQLHRQGSGNGMLPGTHAQVLRLASGGPGPSRLGSSGLGLGLGQALGSGALGGSPTGLGSQLLSSSGGLEELLVGAAGGGGGGAGLPVIELHNRTAELSSKVDAIEHDLRVERSKTDEMRRILADVRDRLNQRPPGTAGGTNAGGISPVDSLTFFSSTGAGAGTSAVVLPPPASSASPFMNVPVASAVVMSAGSGAPGGGYVSGFGSFAVPPSGQQAASSSGHSRYGSTAGINLGPAPTQQQAPEYAPSHSPAKVRVFVDEDAIREQEQHRAVELLTRQADRLKEHMLREHQERRLANSAATASALQMMGPGAAAVPLGLSRVQQESTFGAAGRSRGVSRESSRQSVRRSSPSTRARGGSAGSGGGPVGASNAARGTAVGRMAAGGRGPASDSVEDLVGLPPPSFNSSLSGDVHPRPAPRQPPNVAFGSISFVGGAAAGRETISKASSFSDRPSPVPRYAQPPGPRAYGGAAAGGWAVGGRDGME